LRLHQEAHGHSMDVHYDSVDNATKDVNTQGGYARRDYLPTVEVP